jgi:hypothetical protein
MKSELGILMRRREGGQTIIVAMIILGMLMILGIVFIGIIGRNINTTGTLQARSSANDLAEAGIRFAHNQLVNSEEGADWRPAPTEMAVDGQGLTNDPDAFFLRPAAFAGGQQLEFRPGQPDFGGPDGLGPFTRISFDRGRSLARVRYAPSDINVFQSSPTGALRSPGLVRNYIIIEAVGRSGRVVGTDPTTQASASRKVTNWNDVNEFRQSIANMGNEERIVINRSMKRAFASIGIIETARFVHNKYNQSRAVELGISDMLGAIFENVPVATGDGNTPPLAMELGTFLPLYSIAQNPTLSNQAYPGFGSMHINTDVIIHGQVVANLNKTLGDKFVVAGTMRPANGNSRLFLRTSEWDGTNWQAQQTQLPVIDSRSNAFTTAEGLVIDGIAKPDNSGVARGAGRKEPPSILKRDPNTGLTRYAQLTRESGFAVGGGNSGRFGHGRGIYVNNSADRQGAADELGRQSAGSEVSLTYDWLNPNNGQQGSGWRGFLYVPPAAYVNLLPDGFVIVRNSAAPQDQRSWRTADGADTGNSYIRYRVGRGPDGSLRVVNTYTPGVNINGILGANDFANGPQFNGVLYFDGNARVRGIIPTDVQLTLVSNATIYIEGSITKGVVGNGIQNDAAVGARITRPSHSALMLMAKDYVALNTTQFFGTPPTQALEAVSDTPTNAPGFTPVRVRNSDTITFQSELVLDPTGPFANPANPATWRPYAADYQDQAGVSLITGLLLSQTMDDGPAPATFVGANVNVGVGTTDETTFYFPREGNLADTATSPYGDTVPLYGMGAEPYQRYGRFESILFPFIDPASVNVSDPRFIRNNDDSGTYTLFGEGLNDLLLRQQNYGGIPTNDYLVGKVALLPHDIRIEASIFAEEGSFFVVPGQWFNPIPNDRRDTYASLGATDEERQQQRLERYGSHPGMPFYGEAPDVRVTVIGAVSENMPPTIDQQSEWMRKWGWIPRELGATGRTIPRQHVPNGYDLTTHLWVPNLTITYDPILATARAAGFNADPSQNPVIRMDQYGRTLPPMPKLPVSPSLAYFGEVN